MHRSSHPSSKSNLRVLKKRVLFGRVYLGPMYEYVFKRKKGTLVPGGSAVRPEGLLPSFGKPLPPLPRATSPPRRRRQTRKNWRFVEEYTVPPIVFKPFLQGNELCQQVSNVGKTTYSKTYRIRAARRPCSLLQGLMSAGHHFGCINQPLSLVHTACEMWLTKKLSRQVALWVSEKILSFPQGYLFGCLWGLPAELLIDSHSGP